MKLTVKPIGQRPKCLQCHRELRPNYKRELPPLTIKTGVMVKVRDPHSYGRSQATYIETEGIRSATEEERREFRKEHPPQFLGTYGYRQNSRFCGLNCGYNWAVNHTHPAV